MTLASWFDGIWFNCIYGHNLVCNTCWEDPRLDRVALNLGAEDTLLVITSAGCNTLARGTQSEAASRPTRQRCNPRVASPPKSDRDFTCASSLLNMRQGYSDVSALTRPQILQMEDRKCVHRF
jgi:hypothetical protein